MQTGMDGHVAQHIGQLLAESPSFHRLDPNTRAAMHDSMARIASYLAQQKGASSRQMAPPDLGNRLRPQPGSTTPQPQPTQQPAPTITGPTGRVGDVARATLNAIDFPAFVASLIQGTFQAIVDASIQQMEAYAELLKNCTRTLDQFMQDNVSKASARDYLADKYEGVFKRDTSSGSPQLVYNPDALGNEMPSFFKELGFASPEDIDNEAVENTLVPAARKEMAQMRQQTLATMVLMGINRIVVDDGEISAKLQFHIDASEAMKMRFDQQKTSSMNMTGQAGRNPFAATGIMVNTSSINAQNDINVRADLTGNVRVKFRSDVIPLARFADSAAIQLINQNAKVPEQQTASPVPVAAPPPLPTLPAAGGAQSLAYDPWAAKNWSAA
jgi:hypothetical protein